MQALSVCMCIYMYICVPMKGKMVQHIAVPDIREITEKCTGWNDLLASVVACAILNNYNTHTMHNLLASI